MTDDEKLMSEALEALSRSDYLGWQFNIPIIKALRERLAQPVRESYVHPISGRTADELWQETGRLRSELADLKARQWADERVLVYASPPQRKPLTDEQERKAFEQWYACNSFDYERHPIGSRECGLQWSAWKARAAHGTTGETK